MDSRTLWKIYIVISPYEERPEPIVAITGSLRQILEEGA